MINRKKSVTVEKNIYKTDVLKMRIFSMGCCNLFTILYNEFMELYQHRIDLTFLKSYQYSTVLFFVVF